jgi:hypothetical protein
VPAAPTFPAAPTWGAGGTAPVPPTRRHAIVIVAIAVAVVVAIGAVFAVVNLARDEPAPPGETATPVAGPTIDPTAGPTPAPPATPVTLPGPPPPPTITTTITVATTTTTTTPTTPGGRTETVLGDISVAVPDGWDVLVNDGGQVVLMNDSADAQFEVIAASDLGADAAAVLNEFVTSVLSDQVEQIEVVIQQPAQLPTSAVVSGEQMVYSAVLASQQGSIPVEGLILAYVTQDGTGIVMDTFNLSGQFDNFADDYRTMTDSVIASLSS